MLYPTELRARRRDISKLHKSMRYSCRNFRNTYPEKLLSIQSRLVEYREGQSTFEGMLVWDDAHDGPRPGVLVAHTIRGRTAFEEGKAQEPSMLKSVIFNPFLRFLAVIFVLLGGIYLLFGWLMQIDVNEGYQPIQPIAFSHAVHAGDNKIDCQYCHSSAKNSKTSGIPSANVCMNCHKSISEYTGELFEGHTKEDLDNEIQKIYDAVGWDKENIQYKEGYEQKPIEWVRIHNLADFVYYNHSQHVTVAGFDCKKCHGPVEEMHEVRQFSQLTMDWCITCHRESDVDLTENEYYKNIHDQLANKYGVEKVTEAQLGGLECGKCHY